MYLLVLGFPVATSQIRLAQIKTVMVKTEEQQHQQQRQLAEQKKETEQQQQTQSTDDTQKAPTSPKYYDETEDEEVVARHLNGHISDNNHYSQAHRASPHTSPLTCSPVPSPVRVSLTVQGSSMNTRPASSSTPLSSQRFLPPTTFSSIHQNGYQSPSSSLSKLPNGEAVINSHRMTSTALVSFRNVQRHLQPSQINLSELHQAVEPLSFHTSEPLHDAAARLLSVSLRFGRRLPCFRRLPFRDQVILLEEGWKEMLLLDSVFWMLSLTPGGATEAENNQGREQEFKNMQEALMPLKSLKLDGSEYVCLKAIILFRTSKLRLNE